jgi:polyisoprenyl-phosphate glycosyltransferase
VISLVLPIFNEEEVLPQLYSRISGVVGRLDEVVEIILVDDGSTDDSINILQNIRSENKNFKILQFSRNFGHQAAITAGLEYAQGDAVITMDADLQHPPELIPDLIKMWKEGYDIVYTCRKDTADASAFKKITSQFFYSIINRLSNIEVPDGAADFRLLDRKVVEAFLSFSERRLFIRGLVSWMGYNTIGIPYDAPARAAGNSKYSLIRMLKFAADGITSFSSIPLYISALMGLFISLLSFIYAAFVFYSWLFANKTIEGWTSLMIAVLFIGGVQLIALGILGTYLGRIYDETKRRPRYLVCREYGFTK